MISDVQMPGFSGLRLLREGRLRELDMPVVLMTGNPEVEIAAAAIEHRAFQYLIKPVPAERLFDAVERALNSVESAQASTSVLDEEVPDAPDLALERGVSEGLEFQPIVRASDSTTYGYHVFLLGDDSAMRRRIAEVVAASSKDGTFVIKMSSREASRTQTCSTTRAL